jgi:hypothetical protein
LATAHLILFAEGLDAAQQYLDDVRNHAHLAFNDYNFFAIEEEVARYQHERMENYLPVIEERIKLAQTNLQQVERVKNICATQKGRGLSEDSASKNGGGAQKDDEPPDATCENAEKLADDLSRRAHKGDLNAKNDYAFAIASSVAAGVDDAKPLLARALQYANELCRPDLMGLCRGYPEYGYGKYDIGEFSDTYAYVVIVAEAQKKPPNAGKVRAAIVNLETALADLRDYETTIEQRQSTLFDRRGIRTTIDTMQAHLASARATLASEN